MDNEFIIGLDEAMKRLDTAIDYFNNDAKTVVAVESVNAFKKNFDDEGFFGNKWVARKSKRFGSTNSQKVLSKSGHLKDSISYKIDGDTVTIYSDLPYAEIHNEGGEIEVTPKMKKYFWSQYYYAVEIKDDELMQQYKAFALAKKIKIAKTQFMGEHQQLIDNISNKIIRDLTRIFNGDW